MKNIFFVFLLISNLCYPQKNNLAFQNNERCTYDIDYGFINAGHAKYYIKEKKNYFQVVVQGGSNAIVDLFFPIRDKYETHINKITLLPNYFYRNVAEGGDTIFQEYKFNHHANKAYTQKGIFDIVPHSHDIFSSLFYCRSLSSKQLKKQPSFYINLFVDEKNYEMKIEYLGSEIIKTPIGKIRCMKFSPKVIVGRIFKSPDDLTVWISDDKNHLLVKVEMGILVGSIDATLQSIENIRFPLSISN